MTPALKNNRFRLDIQALRALAVLAVVFYHLWPHQIRGGYVGVDIFFVISGFLITRHLDDELVATGRISLTNFWARRIRRLLPAAFLVLSVCVITLFVAMPLVTWANNFDEIIASALYVVNWLLGHNAVDYLAAENSASLVQHFWSLSVEEQFYLTWPLILLVSVRIHRFLRRKPGRPPILQVLTAVGVVSFLFSVWYTSKSPAMAFFATPTRAWEFAAGGILALTANNTRNLPDNFRLLAHWIGAALIFVSIFLFTGDTSFPGWIAIIPVFGTVLAILAGEQSSSFSLKVIQRSRISQWIGDNSYSIYLWHWPLIISAPWVLHRDISSFDKIAILIITLGLSSLTKHYVEDPMRQRGVLRGRRRAYGLFTVDGVIRAGAG